VGEGQGEGLSLKSKRGASAPRFICACPVKLVELVETQYQRIEDRRTDLLAKVKLLPPRHVRPYVWRNKTDRADTSALPGPTAAAISCRCRSRPKASRAAPRPLWLDGGADGPDQRGARASAKFGFDLPQGPSAVMSKVPGWLDDKSSPIPPALRQAFITVMAEIRDLETRIAAVEKQLRQEAKRGDPYLRTLLIHGARSALNAAVEKLHKGGELTRLQRWAVELAGWVGHNKAATALANKLARIAYAVVRQGRTFDGDFAPAMGKAQAA